MRVSGGTAVVAADVESLENAVTGRELNRLWREFEHGYVDALAPMTEVIVLDIDATDDETHGDQQLSFFHGFYNHHMFHRCSCSTH